MERIATCADEWVCAENNSGFPEKVAGKVLYEVLGIVKDTLMLSVVIMTGTALTLLLW